MVLRTRFYDKSISHTTSALAALVQLHPFPRASINLPFLCPIVEKGYTAKQRHHMFVLCRSHTSTAIERSYPVARSRERKVNVSSHKVHDVPNPEAPAAARKTAFSSSGSAQVDPESINHGFFNLDRSQISSEQKQLMWRAWTGLSDDVQATRLQLLDSLLDMLQTTDASDAYKLRNLLETKQDLLDKNQRNFYSFWSHTILQEPDLAMSYFRKLPSQAKMEYWEFFMMRIVQTGNWMEGVRLWYMILHDAQWRGKMCIRDLLRLIPNSHTWQFLQVLSAREAQEMKNRICFTLIMHLSYTEAYQNAMPLIEETISHARYISDAAIASQMRAFSRHEQHSQALDLYHMVLSAESAPTMRPKMNLAAIDAAAKLSDVRALEKLLETDILASLQKTGKGLRLLLPYTTAMNAFASHGHVSQVDKLFDEFLVTGHKPDVIMLTTLVRARVQALQISQAVEVFAICKREYGIEPDQVAHNILLHGFTSTMDVEAGNSLISAMLQAGIQPDAYTATTYIDLFARTKDSDGAEAAFRRMLKLGVKPNVQVYGSIMHAYLEADDIDRLENVSKEFLKSQLKPNTEIMNILLKQLSRQGRNVKDMQEMVQGMAELGTQPDEITLAQLLRAMLSEGDMESAVKLFQSLKKPTEYHYTIMMVGLSRESTKESHDALLYYYNEMLDHGIRPSYVTMAVLMNAFVLRGTPAAAKRARDLLDSLESWKDVDVSSKFVPRNLPSPDVYMPLVARSKSAPLQAINPEQVYNKFLKSILGTDARPNMTIQTAMMSVYAAASQTEQVKQIFDAIKREADRLYKYKSLDDQESDHGSEHTISSKDNRTSSANLRQISRGGRFVLSIPMTVFAKHLASVRAYTDLETTWLKLREDGYDFDVSTWNLLVQIQISRGKLDSACQIIEDNLLVTGGRIFKRTKYQLRAALDALKSAQQDSSVDELTKSIEHNDGLWTRIEQTHESVILAIAA